MPELWSLVSSSSKAFVKQQVLTQLHGKGGEDKPELTESLGLLGEYQCLEKSIQNKRMEDPERKETAAPERDQMDQTE